MAEEQHKTLWFQKVSFPLWYSCIWTAELVNSTGGLKRRQETSGNTGVTGGVLFFVIFLRKLYKDRLETIITNNFLKE